LYKVTTITSILARKQLFSETQVTPVAEIVLEAALQYWLKSQEYRD